MKSKDTDFSEDDFYFEDDRDYEGYPGCGVSIPPVCDPLSLLNPDRLSKFNYGGVWSKFDSLNIKSQQDNHRPSIAFINDQRVPIHRRTDLYDYMFSLSDLPGQRDRLLPFVKMSCPYCKTRLDIHQVAEGKSKWDEDEEFEDEVDEYAKVYALEYCRNCRYWRWHDFNVFTSFEEVHHTYKGFLSKFREFDNILPDGFTQEFAQWIRANERRWHTMQPKSLERIVSEIIRSTYQASDVMHVGRPDDGGVDVVFVESQDKKWLIQVKRREKARHGEPVDTVRNLLGTMVLESSNYGMIVSTADHFTFRAYEAAQRAREKGMFIELVDKGKLNRMLDSILPTRPWLDVLKAQYPSIAPEFDEVICE